MIGLRMSSEPIEAGWTLEALLKSQPPHYRHEVSRYEQFYLIGVLQGTLHFRDDRHSVAVGPGRLLVLRPESAFVLHTEGHGYSGVAIEVRDADISLLRGPSAVADPQNRISTLAEWLESELAVPRGNSRATVYHIGSLLVELALRETSSLQPGEPQIAREIFWARRAREAIENSLYSGQGVQEVLGRLPVSYRQLSRYLQSEFGLSAKQLHSRARIAEAKRLLSETSWSVTTIALELGYSSLQHFASSFRQSEGASPGKWRSTFTVGSSGTRLA